MDDYGNSLHWRRSVVDSPLSGKESPVFGLAAVRPGEDFQFAADNSFGCSFSSPLDWNDEQVFCYSLFASLLFGLREDQGTTVEQRLFNLIVVVYNFFF